MEKFRQNILCQYGNKGEEWLKKIPRITVELQEHWGLKELDPVHDMTYHYIVKALYKDDIRVVVKIGYDTDLLKCEWECLKLYHGHGAVRVLDYCFRSHAILLQQAKPGTPLKNRYPMEEGKVMDAYVEVLDKLLSVKGYGIHNNLADWLSALNNSSGDVFKKGRVVGERLLHSIKKSYLLHGDLHLKNILRHGDNWLAIDPKGVIGEREFEAAAFNFIADTEIEGATKELLLQRIRALAEKGNFSFERLRDWTFVRCVLSASWSIEDGADPSQALKLAALLEDDYAAEL